MSHCLKIFLGVNDFLNVFPKQIFFGSPTECAWSLSENTRRVGLHAVIGFCLKLKFSEQLK